MFVIKHCRDVSLTYSKILWSMRKLLIVRLRLYGEIIWSLIFVTLANHIHNFDIFRPGQNGKPLPRLHIIRKDSQSITLPPYHWLFQDTTETFVTPPFCPISVPAPWNADHISLGLGSAFCTKWSFSAILKILNVRMPVPISSGWLKFLPALNLNPG